MTLGFGATTAGGASGFSAGMAAGVAGPPNGLRAWMRRWSALDLRRGSLPQADSGPLRELVREPGPARECLSRRDSLAEAWVRSRRIRPVPIRSVQMQIRHGGDWPLSLASNRVDLARWSVYRAEFQSLKF